MQNPDSKTGGCYRNIVCRKCNSTGYIAKAMNGKWMRGLWNRGTDKMLIEAGRHKAYLGQMGDNDYLVKIWKKFSNILKFGMKLKERIK